ncbi:hypothetical protein [Streptomyces hayashii]|uniref:hypothetical protein n=1 Tax=Streptomyces hayashii TaxID=2839966 RepID=UPI00403D49A3
MRPAIWTGDAVRALAVARTEAEQARVLELLGLASVAVPSPVPPVDHEPGDSSPDPDTAGRPSAPGPRRESGPAPEPDPDAPGPAADAPSGPETEGAGPPLLSPVRVEPVVLPNSPDELLPVPAAHPARLPHLSLLVPRWTGAILRSAVSRRVHDGPVDVAALTDLIARGRPVDRFPRLAVPTLRYGVQVLVDRGGGMQPFRRDQNQLAETIRAVVGERLVEVGFFSDVPLRGTGPGPRWTRTGYRPPEPGRPVLLLTDFGIGGPPDDPRRAARDEWEEFAAVVTRAGCDIAALCPYPPQRRPDWVSRLCPVIHWDRATPAGRTGVSGR